MLFSWLRLLSVISLFVMKIHNANNIGNSKKSINTTIFLCANDKAFAVFFYERPFLYSRLRFRYFKLNRRPKKATFLWNIKISVSSSDDKKNSFLSLYFSASA